MLQKLRKEIQSTLDRERSNIFEGHQDEDNLRGWIEALEYVQNRINFFQYKENCKNSDLK
tara:strand:- start:64 stop:243 length:180 start_codon:yes stop_codon:yes gene_type:complete